MTDTEMNARLVLPNTDEILRENRSLKRQLRDLDALLQRNKAMLAARDSVNALMSAEREKMENTMRLLLENSPDIILLFDCDGRFTYCTNIFSTVTGIVDEDLVIGHHFVDVFNRFTDASFTETLENKYKYAMKQKKTIEFSGEIDFLGAENTRVYNIHITPMLVSGGTPEGAVMLFHDLDDIIKAKEAAEKANSVKTSFLASMSHEMRTPLNAITGMLHIARSTSDQQQLEAALQKIKTASNHLLSVINDILDMSKIETGKLELSEGYFVLSNVISGVEDIIMYQITEKKLDLIKTIEQDLPIGLFGDKDRLTQVLANLLSNAVKFTQEGGRISIEISRCGERDGLTGLLFKIIDSGIGISEEQQLRLFKPFVQADSSISRRYGGTGLGLVIAKNIVESMGGEIGVESSIGEGACFNFSVWLKEAEFHIDKHCDFAVENVNLDGIFAGRRILLAEDIEINREIVVALLEPTGVQLDVAHDGKEAYECFCENSEEINLILMDINMPEVNGYQAVERIRSSGLPCSHCVPIIAMTANAFKEDVEQCLAIGMNAHISKPIELDELFRVLKKYLQ